MARGPKRKRTHAQEYKAKRLARHFGEIGLNSEEQYRAWCIAQGLSKELHKSDYLRKQELELARKLQGEAALTHKRRNTRSPQKTIAQLYSHELGKEDLGAEYLEKIRVSFESFEEGAARAAFHDLLMHTERYGELFGTAPAIPYLGPVPGNTFIEAMGLLARQHDGWIRPVENWKPNSHNPRRQFSHLARHLLARYDVPFFMDAAWFQEDVNVAIRQQNWFVHVGNGQNIRTADVPVKLTKMMAHQFATAPDELPIERALRWGQVVGQGGSHSLARAVIGSRLGMHFEHEEFWETVIKFLVNHPMLDPSMVGPIIDFAHHQKFEPCEIVRPGGEVDIAPPPQPNFSVKGRSIGKLLQLMEEWHEDLGGAFPGDEETSRRGRRDLVRWDPSGIGSLRLQEQDPNTGEMTTWMVQELNSNRELAAEGRAMHHCVASYEKNCRKGSTSVWSLQAVADKERQNVMTIAVDARRKNVTQVRGKYNIAPVGKASNGHQKALNRSYMRLLSRSQRIFDRWVKQEGLSVRC